MTNKLELHLGLVFWSPTLQTFQKGKIVWISPRRNLVALQVGGQTEFLTPEQLDYNPFTEPADEEITSLPSADPQDKPDRDRYLYMLGAAFPGNHIRSITIVEAVRTCCRTGRRRRVFCHTAILQQEHGVFLLDVDAGSIAQARFALNMESLDAIAHRPWSPCQGIPNQCDALYFQASEMAKVRDDAKRALASGRSIGCPDAAQSVKARAVGHEDYGLPSDAGRVRPVEGEAPRYF